MNVSEYEWRESEVTHARIRDVIVPAILGIAVGSVFGAYGEIPSFTMIPVSMVLFVFLYRAVAGGFKNSTILAIFLLAVLVGVARGEGARSGLQADISLLSRNAEIVGVVSEEVEGNKANLRTMYGQMLVRLPWFAEVSYGDSVRVSGAIELPEDFRNDSGVVFRYRDFLRARGVVYLMKANRVEVISHNGGERTLSLLYELKSWVRERYHDFPEPESSLFLGMFLGGKSGLSKEIQQDFITSGLIHIVVLSGANLAMVAGATFVFLRSLFGFRTGVIFASSITVAYAFMGGAEPATLRALVMTLLAFLAIFLHREVEAPRLLLVGAAMLVIDNPFLVLDDPSFQLSILALSGLIFIAPVVESYLFRYEKLPYALLSYLSAIVGAQFMVLPLLVHMSGQFTPYALFANVLVLGALAPIVPLGLPLLVPAISGTLYSLFALPLLVLLRYVVAVSHLVSHLPFSSMKFSLHTSSMFIIYIMLCTWLYRRWKSPEMSPLSRYAIREEREALRAGRVPWTPDDSQDGEEEEGLVQW